MSKIKINLGTVQETALYTLWARASERQQADPVLVDSKSAEILSAIDYDFSKFTPARKFAVGTCLRAMVVDKWVRRYIAERPNGTIVEIGAGLNTRFERVDNGTIHWFDLDLPDIMAMRRQFFQDSSRRQSIAASALDTNWHEQVLAVSSSCMFIAEGVLIYFNEAQVKQLLTFLVEHFPGSNLIFDSNSPLGVKLSNRIFQKYFSAKFDWSMDNVTKVQDWDRRYKVMEICKFSDLPAQYMKRYSLPTRLLSSYIPIFKDLSRLALVRLG